MLAVLQPGDVLVGHSGGGLEITRAADAAPELVSHVVYLAAALPLEGRLMQEALVYRDDGGIEGDYDVTGMLKHLRIGDDGSMAFADVEGARELFYNDCDEATARWAFERLTPETAGRHRDDADLRPAVLGRGTSAQLHRVPAGPRATAVARRRHRAPPRCRTTHDRRVTLAVPQPPRRARAAPRPRDDDSPGRPHETQRLIARKRAVAHLERATRLLLSSTPAGKLPRSSREIS